MPTAPLKNCTAMGHMSVRHVMRCASPFAALCGRVGLFLLFIAPCVSAEQVYFGETSRIRGFDPIRVSDVPSVQAVSKVYEGLYQYAYLERPYRVEPCLATALPDVSPDGLTYVIPLRRGIFFADDPCFTDTAGRGREVTAEDWVYSLKRLADRRNRSVGYWVLNDRIDGLDEFREASGGATNDLYARSVAGIQARDRYTVVLKLKRPYPQLLWVLTMNYTFVVPREAVDRYAAGFVNHPVGTGPFILKEYRPNYRLEFVRNPAWIRTGRVDRYPAAGADGDRTAGLLADAGKTVPFLDRIVQYVIGDPSTQWLMFLRGQLAASGISRDNWDAVLTPARTLRQDLADRGIRLSMSPALQTGYIGFNMEDPVVGGTNRLLRRALSCAIDSAQWEKFYNGRVVRAKGPIPPGIDGYSDRVQTWAFDPARARQLLADAGYPGGIDPRTGRRLQLTIELGSTETETREAVELIIDFMNRVGINLRPNYQSWPLYLSRLERRDAQMFWLEWIADYPDAENFLQLFYGPNVSPGANHANYVNPAFDRLYEQARTMPDGSERTALYRAMTDIVIEDSPWIFLHHPLSCSLHHAWLGNFKPHDFPYGMLKYYRAGAAAGGGLE